MNSPNETNNDLIDWKKYCEIEKEFSGCYVTPYNPHSEKYINVDGYYVKHICALSEKPQPPIQYYGWNDSPGEVQAEENHYRLFGTSFGG
jgi:hypothetical protein